MSVFNPYRTLERDGSVTSGYAEREVVDALHGPTGNKEPLIPTLRVGGRASGAGDSYDNTPWGDYPAEPADDPLLPRGLDSHRYRCCGNGVVSGVSEWLGERIAAHLRAERAA